MGKAYGTGIPHSQGGVFAICGAVIFTGEAFVENQALLVKNGQILDIAPLRHIPRDLEIIEAPEAILAPGFIDCQVNGGGNSFFNENPTAETALAIAEAHLKSGTTRLFPTLITETPETTRKALQAMIEARQVCPNILGVHIEGPHISLARRGVHNAAQVRKLSEEDLDLYKDFAESKRGGRLILTVAPESVTPHQVKVLSECGVIVSLGHTESEPKQIRAVLEAGARCFTHLFNGMGGLSARSPGPAGVALDDEASYCSIIADGHHVSAEMLRIAYRLKQEKLFLVSDAMPPAATTNPQDFMLYDEKIRIEQGACFSGTGNYAGSMATLVQMVGHLIRTVKIQPEAALQMASRNVAQFLGVGEKYGKLLPGYEADIVLLTPAFGVNGVWRSGIRIF